MPETETASALHIVPPIALRRRITDHVMTGVAVLTVILVLVPLFAIFAYLVYRGIGSINWAFLTQTPKPVGEAGGGMANAIVGSAFILALASVIGVPVGWVRDLSGGVWTQPLRRCDSLHGRCAERSAVHRNRHRGLFHRGSLSEAFFRVGGGVALAIMMIPTITRTTEEMLLLVPQALREAAYGLGIPRWRTTLSITLRTATSGVITGIMLAFARVAGETAPLLFTAFGNQFWNLHANQPTAALPLQIFNYAISPYDEWHRQAWAGALVLIILIVSAVAAVRFAVRRGTFGAA
jgi:phosphate transport system permease protein